VIRFGVYLPTGFGREFAHIPDPMSAYETITGLARTADEAGFHSLWVTDHLHTIPQSQEFLFESWSTLTALARDTSRIRLGHLATGNGYRNPALLAKTASTVDVLSHGRFTLGIGAGWYEAEYAGYGYDFGTRGGRLRRLDEAAQIIRSMWTEAETTFEGTYYQARGAINQPKGVQVPHIPLLVAGGGEQVTLRIAGQYADMCNIIESPSGLAHKFAVVRKHAEDHGRDCDSIVRTTATLCYFGDTDAEAKARVPAGMDFVFPGNVREYGLIGTVGTIRERIAAYEAAGVQEIAITFENPTDAELLRRFAAEFITT